MDTDAAVAVPYRLKIKVGEAEFEAEGPEETVKAQFELFMHAVSEAPKKSTSPRDSSNDEVRSEVLGEHHRSLMNRAFVVNGDRVSLRVLPQTSSPHPDALVLLLYGYHQLKNVHDVTSPELMAAAKQSGIQRDRLDRIMPMEFINRGGQKRGTRYGLNNRGIAKAQELLEEMFE